jgi:hypothetical protein
VPNPQGTATDTLVKLGIEGTIYDFASGGGLSGDYIHELLWDYVNDNNGTIPFGTYSVTLAESIDKYDCISMCFKSNYSDTGNWVNVTLFLIDVNALKTNPMHANYFSYTSFGDRASAFYLSGKTLQKIIDSVSNINGLVAVYGIKYGGNNIKYSTDEHVVGTWIDGSTLYERTIILRENGVDKYTFTGSMSEGGNYAVGLTGIDKIWLDGLYSKRGKSGDTDYTDIDNNSTEVVTVFKHTDCSFYFKDIHAPLDIILTIRYTKSTT